MKSPLHHRNGFTLVEVTIACSLTAFLAILLSTTWVLLMRPTADLIVWGQIFQEMDIAVASLARDLGGSLPDCMDSSNLLDKKTQGILLECKSSNDSDGDHLLLCFDGGASPDSTADWGISTSDTVIDYYVHVDGNLHSLIRLNKKTGTQFTVATDVSNISVGDAPSDATRLQIVLTFSHDVKATGKTLTRKCILIAKKHP